MKHPATIALMFAVTVATPSLATMKPGDSAPDFSVMTVSSRSAGLRPVI